jgi:hypothetical protein
VVEGLDTLGEYLDFVEAVPDGLIKLAEGILVENLDGVTKAFDWFKDTGKDLVRCGKESIVCQFSFDEWEGGAARVGVGNYKLNATTIE